MASSREVSQEPKAAALNLSAEEPPSLLWSCTTVSETGGCCLGRGRWVVHRELEKPSEIHVFKKFCLLFGV